MRAFLALELPDALREELRLVSAALRPKLEAARFVRAENIHLTLRFLGETNVGVANRLLVRLRRELGEVGRFELRVRGVGAFPSERKARVLWAGIVDASERLDALASRVEALSVEAGFEPESRPFSPHLTLARFKSPARHLQETIAPWKDRDFGALPVAALTCFESRLSPKGASYRVVERLDLAL